ncbi:MAG: universal stress protein [Chloroflexi bacterium]|nr:universal stress protein [Chloroflexota bacterium]
MLYRKILVPLDGSPGSWEALDKALLQAKLHNAEITALSVEENLPHYAATVGEVEEEKAYENGYFARVQGRAMAIARAQGIELKGETVVGHAAQNIVRYARNGGFDLIVISHTGHSGVWGVLLGSTTSRVVDQAHCDVLVVR